MIFFLRLQKFFDRVKLKVCAALDCSDLPDRGQCRLEELVCHLLFLFLALFLLEKPENILTTFNDVLYLIGEAYFFLFLQLNVILIILSEN